MINDTIKLSRLANRLLGELEDISANTLHGDNADPRKMEAILGCFEKIEQMVEERYADQLKHSNTTTNKNS